MDHQHGPGCSHGSAQDALPGVKDQVILVLGATGAVGSALARRLAGGGARLVLCGRDVSKVKALADPLRAHALACDAADDKAVQTAVETALEKGGRLDGLACCVGTLPMKVSHLASVEEWNEAVRANLTPAFLAVRHGAKAMMDLGGGSIVLVSAAHASLGVPMYDLFSAVKAGVEGLARSAAASYAPRGIRVNCVAPGLLRTPLTEKLTASEAGLKAASALHAAGRLGTAGEVAGAIAWLLEPAQSWMTGHVLAMDGGFASVRAANRHST